MKHLDPKNPEHRRIALEDRVRLLMREGAMSYDEAWRTANSAADMKPFVDAMVGGSGSPTPADPSKMTLQQRGDALNAIVRQRMAELGEDHPTAFRRACADPANAALMQAMQGGAGYLGQANTTTTRDGDTHTSIIPIEFANRRF
ncbi:MAG: hypothetical protein WDN28_15445 [Chthoniobacter sp.]